MKNEKRLWPLLVAVMGAWAGALAWLEIQKFLNFRAGADLGIFTQAIWSTAHGHPFYMSLLGGPGNFLGHHFAPLLALLAPFYRLWPDARLLLVAQALALALAAVPLYLFARPRLGAAAALLVVLAYFLYPPLHGVALADFHEISLAVPLLMAAGAALIDGRLRLAVIFLALAVLVKEEVALVAIGFGLYAWFVLRRPRFGAALTVSAAAAAALIFAAIIPALNGPGGFAFFTRYATMGGAPARMLQTFLLHPLTVLRLVTTPDKLWFTCQLLLPLAGLPLLGFPVILLGLPTYLYLMLSDYAVETSIGYYYPAPMIPFLLLAAVVGLQRVRCYGARPLAAALGTMLMTVLIAARLWSPLPGGLRYEPAVYQVAATDRAAQALLRTIPAEASVAADGEYAAWVANRLRMASIAAPPGSEIAPGKVTEYLAVRTPRQDEITSPTYPAIVSNRPGAPIEVPRYDLVQQAEQGLALWKWRGPEQTVSLSRYDAGFDEGLILVAAGTPPEGPAWGPLMAVSAGTIVPVWMAWQAGAPLERRITFSLHLVDAQDRLVAQADREMGEGHFPTTLWQRWHATPTVAGEFPLELPRQLPAGRYRLLGGAFETETVSTLGRTDGGQWVELAQFEVR